MYKLGTLALIGGAAFLLATGANASVVTSIPGGVVHPMPQVNYLGHGPQAVEPGITWSSTYNSWFGLTSGYGFGSNGLWFVSSSYAATP